MDPREAVLEAFIQGPWGQASATTDGAQNLCKRASLALLAELEFQNLGSGVRLWSLAGAREGAGRGETGTGIHWVLSFDEELVDVSARQFEPDGPHVRRGPLAAERALWEVTEAADPDDAKWWRGDILRREEIHPGWRSLSTQSPPGLWPQ